MRTLQILPELNEGGVERGVIETNREFALLGHDSHVISAGGKMSDLVTQQGGSHHVQDVCSKNIFTARKRIIELRSLLEQVSPDIVHARSRVPAWLAHFANKRKKRPFVTTVHGLNSVNGYSKIMTAGDRVICVSEVVKDYIIKNYNTDSSKIRVIQRGVDMNQFDPAKSNQKAIAHLKEKYRLQNKLVITSVGRITWLKDYESFIRAMAIVCQDTPEAVGLVVGGSREDKSDYLESLKQLARNLKLEDKIVFTGSLSDIASVYAMSHIVVNASLKMGNMGRTVVEALALGKPVIATTFKGLNNLVVDEENGFIIQNKDPEGLARAINKTIKASFDSFSIRSTVPDQYTLDYMVKSILSVYQEIL